MTVVVVVTGGGGSSLSVSLSASPTTTTTSQGRRAFVEDASTTQPASGTTPDESSPVSPGRLLGQPLE